MKKTIRMRMTNERFHEITGLYSKGDLGMASVDVDLDRLSNLARFIAENITATYVLDEATDVIDVSAEASESMEERDRRSGKSEQYIANMANGYGESYTNDRMKIDHITFPIYGRQFKSPEEVIETVATELVKAGAARLYARNGSKVYNI